LFKGARDVEGELIVQVAEEGRQEAGDRREEQHRVGDILRNGPFQPDPYGSWVRVAGSGRD
jgi:hypothetical protein